MLFAIWKTTIFWSPAPLQPTKDLGILDACSFVISCRK